MEIKRIDYYVVRQPTPQRKQQQILYKGNRRLLGKSNRRVKFLADTESIIWASIEVPVTPGQGNGQSVTGLTFSATVK